jgi:hypothetical protein
LPTHALFAKMDPSYEDGSISILKNIEEKNFDSLKTSQERILKRINLKVATQAEFEYFFNKKVLFRNFFGAEYCVPEYF